MKTAFSIIGILVSIVVIIMGIILCSESVYYYVGDAEFGADFYTYIYDATRKVALIGAETATAVYRGFGYLLIAVGALSLCGFACNIDKKGSDTPLPRVTSNFEPGNDPLANIAPMNVQDDPNF